MHAGCVQKGGQTVSGRPAEKTEESPLGEPGEWRARGQKGEAARPLQKSPGRRKVKGGAARGHARTHTHPVRWHLSQHCC